MDANQEALDILERIWNKLQNLHQADPIEIGGFLILILFILTLLALGLFACTYCCCRCGQNPRKNNLVI